MSEQLVLAAIAIVAASGVVGLAFSRNSAAGQYVATALASVGSVVGIGGLIAFWMFSSSRPIAYPWSVPGGEFAVAVDGLSAVFLLPVFLVSLLGNIYGLEYWAQAAHPENGRKLRLFYRTCHRRHGTSGRRPKFPAVSGRVGNHGPLGVLFGDDRGSRSGSPEGRLGLPGLYAYGHALLICTVRAPPLGRRLVFAHFDTGRSSHEQIRDGRVHVGRVGIWLEGRHHAAAPVAARCTRDGARAMYPR